MDGPSVNWKLLELLQERRFENDPLAPDLLSIGSCSLHVLYGAFNTGWQLAKVGKNCCSILNKSPARRVDCLAASNLQETYEGRNTSHLLQLKFCGHRWLEYGLVIKRLLEIFSYMKT